MVSHDIVKTCQQAQAGTDLHMHGAVHIVEQVESLIDQLTALFQKTCRKMIFKRQKQKCSGELKAKRLN